MLLLWLIYNSVRLLERKESRSSKKKKQQPIDCGRKGKAASMLYRSKSLYISLDWIEPFSIAREEEDSAHLPTERQEQRKAPPAAAGVFLTNIFPFYSPVSGEGIKKKLTEECCHKIYSKDTNTHRQKERKESIGAQRPIICSTFPPFSSCCSSSIKNSIKMYRQKVLDHLIKSILLLYHQQEEEATIASIDPTKGFSPRPS